MVLVQAKSAQFDSTCNRETCEIQIKTSAPYIFDTEAKKGYCSKECGEMATGLKIQENGTKQFGFKKAFTPQEQWRKPEEGLAAITIWHQTVVAMIHKTCESLGNVSDNKFEVYRTVTQTYQEIFLGKMRESSKK